jgi:hypothetical protein
VSAAGGWAWLVVAAFSAQQTPTLPSAPTGTPACAADAALVRTKRLLGCVVVHDGKAVRQGPQWITDNGGRVVEAGAFEGDKRQGAWRSFDAQGRLLEERVYVDDLLDGVASVWAADGTLRRTVAWQRGQRHGVERVYDAAGVPLLERVYERGTVVREQVLLPPADAGP